MIVEPPSSAGAFHDMEADVGVMSFASSKVGGPGTPRISPQRDIKEIIFNINSDP